MATKRPNLWSYVSFSLPLSRPDLRRTLPTHHEKPGDEHEKPERYSNSHPNSRFGTPISSHRSSRVSSRAMAARQRAMKWLAIAFAVTAALYLFGPGGQDRRDTLVGDRLPFSLTKDTHQTKSKPRCRKPHDPSKPLIQYALMIDAGSTGSRIHVYRFNNCAATPELENEVFEQTDPKPGGSGLSSYGANAEEAAKSLDTLLEKAIGSVPKKHRSCTPIAVKATAGLRMLGPKKSQQILKAVRHRLETHYPFPVLAQDKGGVEVMDGKDEGVYAWITMNYLLGNIGNPNEKPTAAVFDLGGGSTQIVFQPTYPIAAEGQVPEKMPDGDHKYDLQFGGRNFSLYQHSYLGYGLMAARNSLHQLAIETAHETSRSVPGWLHKPIENPCISPGAKKIVAVTMPKEHPLGDQIEATMVGPSTPKHEECLELAEIALNKDAECILTPCAFNGVHQPSLTTTFAEQDIYLFSYFYDRLSALGMPQSFTLQELQEVTAKVCGGKDSWKDFEEVDGAIEELTERPEYCLDLNYMLALLVKGYEMPLDRKVNIAKQIKGNELGWALGASLPLLSQGSGWKCKVKEVS